MRGERVSFNLRAKGWCARYPEGCVFGRIPARWRLGFGCVSDPRAGAGGSGVHQTRALALGGSGVFQSEYPRGESDGDEREFVRICNRLGRSRVVTCCQY